MSFSIFWNMNLIYVKQWICFEIDWIGIQVSSLKMTVPILRLFQICICPRWIWRLSEGMPGRRSRCGHPSSGLRAVIAEDSFLGTEKMFWISWVTFSRWYCLRTYWVNNNKNSKRKNSRWQYHIKDEYLMYWMVLNFILPRSAQQSGCSWWCLCAFISPAESFCGISSWTCLKLPKHASFGLLEAEQKALKCPGFLRILPQCPGWSQLSMLEHTWELHRATQKQVLLLLQMECYPCWVRDHGCLQCFPTLDSISKASSSGGGPTCPQGSAHGGRAGLRR